MPTIKKPRIYTTSYGRYQFVREGTMNRNSQGVVSSTIGQEIARDYFRDVHGETFQERFCVLTLDTKHKPIAWYVITVGTLDASLVHPREVFKPAIIDSACAIMLAHNHPSGDPTPSREDRLVTDRLKEAGTLLGITVLDHITVGDGSWRTCSITEAT